MYVPATGSSQYPRVGISGTIRFNSSTTLTVPILGSIRTIQDFTEGPSLLYPQIQKALMFNSTSDGGVAISRLWLDNVTVTDLAFVPQTASGAGKVTIGNQTINLTAGDHCRLQLPAADVAEFIHGARFGFAGSNHAAPRLN